MTRRLEVTVLVRIRSALDGTWTFPAESTVLGYWDWQSLLKPRRCVYRIVGIEESRRTVLRGAAGLAATAIGFTGHSRARADENGFDPVRHGFGFRNWGVGWREFDIPESELDPSQVAVRDHILTEWDGHAESLFEGGIQQTNEVFLETLATILRSAIVQRTGTNGHCYGMSLAAQAYYESPSSIPIDRLNAAAIRHPAEPLADPEAPVYRDIAQLQAEQYLRFRSWLGRRAMLWPERIDVADQLGDIRAVIDVFGTAQVFLFAGTTRGHQVLAYEYEDRADGTTVSVYDPNYAASSYEHRIRTLEFDRIEGGYEVRPYEAYDGVLFNRHDRIEAATGRSDVSPFDHFDGDPSRLRETMFPTALVTVDTADVDLGIAGPSGSRFDRLVSDFMDVTRGDVSHIRTAYGIKPGTYRIHIHGRRRTAYDLRVRIAGPADTRLSASRTAAIEAGEVHVYEAIVPENADERGELRRVDEGNGRSIRIETMAGTAGGFAAGIGAYHLWRRRRNETNE